MPYPASASRGRLRHRIVPLLALLAAGCRGPADADVNERVCPQSYEFANHGCAEIRGRVLGTGDQPLQGAVVHPSFLTDLEGAAHTMPSARTDAQGRFVLRVARMVQWPTNPLPEVFPVYVVAVLVPGPGAGGIQRDSVLVELRLAPVGSTPTPAHVEIRLPYP